MNARKVKPILHATQKPGFALQVATLAAATILGMGSGAPAGAAVVATITETGTNPLAVGTDVISCSSCASSGGSTYNFSAGATALAFDGPATPFSDGYDSESFLALGGTLSITNGASNLVSGSFTGGTVYAVVGSSSAVLELDLTDTSSNVLNLPSAALYFDISGSTPAPVELSKSGDFTITGLDWTAQLSTTPFTPVPLPASGVLLAGALLVLLAAAYGRRLGRALRFALLRPGAISRATMVGAV